ncbi:hypothetical protein LAZ67_8003414 [Cordylochernes scorpioides]|uniref:DUF5641 domain-containing protein n=1 Tax=Cordylochernes scorpioides TaxID=51811 RepID=A0ABY6KRJ2_9ARAC|nr:hypothetical protein LAZ67_8003414 [Cordylochernes scorpioides]
MRSTRRRLSSCGDQRPPLPIFEDRVPVGHWTRDGCRRIVLQSWLPGGPPPWADRRWYCFSGNDADVALWLALYALSHSDSRHTSVPPVGPVTGSWSTDIGVAEPCDPCSGRYARSSPVENHHSTKTAPSITNPIKSTQPHNSPQLSKIRQVCQSDPPDKMKLMLIILIMLCVLLGHSVAWKGERRGRCPQVNNNVKCQKYYNKCSSNSDCGDLHKCCGNPCGRKFEGFALSADNYEKAIKLLEDRFGREDILISRHMNNLLSMRPLKTSSDVRTFREPFDNLSVQIRSLESLNVSIDAYGQLLCPIIIKLLPADLNLELNKRIPDRLHRGGSSKSSTVQDETLANLSTSPNVLLPTLRVTLKGNRTEKTARDIIDKGSQRSYILHNTAMEMEYEQSRREFLQHSLFGGSSTDVVEHEVYTIHLSDINNSYRCEFEALGQPLICGSIPPVSPRSFLEGSEELDVSDLMRDRIEVLIGADIAGRLLTDDQKRISSGLLVRDDTSSLCMTTLLSLDLENLWKLDAIGVADAEVEKKTQERIPSNKDLAENQLSSVRRKLEEVGDTKENKRNTVRDTLTIGLEDFELIGPTTKRKVISIASKLFDPLGVSLPVTIIPKLILQETWTQKLTWDEVRPGCLVQRFWKWFSKLKHLPNIEILRWFCFKDSYVEKTILNIFCNPSQFAYATCILLRIEKEDRVDIQLIQARTRVAPLKKLTIPRLELLACLIGAPLVANVIQDLEFEKIPRFYWADSTNAVCWIQSEDKWDTFVMNRVKEIDNLSSFEILAPHTRPIKPGRLPISGIIVRITAWIYRFFNNAKIDRRKIITEDLSTEESTKSEIILMTLIQRESFSGHEDKKLQGFKLLVDSSGILRIKTKICRREYFDNFRMPILLPSDHFLVSLLIRKTIKKIINQYIRCKRFTVTPATIESTSLPEDRVRDAAVFEIVGDLVPLAPSLFLHEVREVGVPDLDLIDNQTLSLKYQYIKRVREDLRERYCIEYFGFLRQETRRLKTTIPFKVGYMVLIGQKSLKRLHWPLARIIQLYPGKDGLVRVAKVKPLSGDKIRPIQKLYNLEITPEIRCRDPPTERSPTQEVRLTTEEDPLISQKEQHHIETSNVVSSYRRLIKRPNRLDLLNFSFPCLSRRGVNSKVGEMLEKKEFEAANGRPTEGATGMQRLK